MERIRFYTDESETCALIEEDLRKTGTDFVRIPIRDDPDISPPSIDCSHGFFEGPAEIYVYFLNGLLDQHPT